MSLSTKDVNVGGGGTSKTLIPGERLCKVNKITLEDFKFKAGHKFLVLHLEGEPMGDGFQGFLEDTSNPTGPRYQGQIGRVRTSDFAYNDGITPKGRQVYVVDEVMKALKSLCIAMRIETWYDAQDLKYDTIPDFLEAMNNERPYKDIWLNYCIAGNQYVNKAGYTNHDLFLPKFADKKVPYELPDTLPSKLIKFDPAVHVKVRKTSTKNVEEFGETTTTVPANDPSFDL